MSKKRDFQAVLRPPVIGEDELMCLAVKNWLPAYQIVKQCSECFAINFIQCNMI